MKRLLNASTHIMGFTRAEALSVLAIIRISLLTPVLLREATG